MRACASTQTSFEIAPRNISYLLSASTVFASQASIQYAIQYHLVSNSFIVRRVHKCSSGDDFIYILDSTFPSVETTTGHTKIQTIADELKPYSACHSYFCHQRKLNLIQFLDLNNVFYTPFSLAQHSIVHTTEISYCGDSGIYSLPLFRASRKLKQLAR